MDQYEPAFPIPYASQNNSTGETRFYQSEGGISKREYFAVRLMQGFISSTFTNTGGQCVGITGAEGKTSGATPEVIAEYSLKYADALLDKLSKGNNSK